MTDAFVGGVTFQRLNTAASPNAYATIEEMISMSGLGKTNDLIEATSFDSTAKEYIAGLADGSEISVECNYDSNGTVQQALRTDVNNGTTSTFKVTITDSTVSPNLVETFTFSATCLSWTINPSVDDRNTVTFTIKISGDITIA